MKHEALERRPCEVGSVLVVDDHPLYGAALEQALRHVFDGCEIVTATTLHDGLQALGKGFRPDMVLLDLKLPDVTGISGCLRLREELPDVAVVVISSLTSDEVIEAVMDAGAAGFVPKDAPMADLRAALCEVRSGLTYLPKGFSRVRHAPQKQKLRDKQDVARKIAELTPQQTRIMKLICVGKPNKQIAYEMDLAEATVKAHITALLRRLGVQNRTQAAVLVESASLDAAAEQSDTQAFLSN
ncbi:response regulator transcription factor [Vannielia litorea]|uniref:response regulator n=1 Tax=Vannielia litorea TaxID=1217970 RepID=UPI001C94526A|nr:response regulator transcription factor [Vannielia litorea]MBY6152861.1 response regulator transcription factor [Vannielia litorea]